MFKVLLIKPPYSRLKSLGQSPYFPLGLGYIAAVLEKADYEVGIYHAETPRSPAECIIEDEEAIFHQRSNAQNRYYEAVSNDDHPVWKEVRQTIDDFKPDLVGISVLTVEVPAALKISKICKTYNSQMPVVWGGIHPTFLPEQVLRYGPVDVVVKGEGEMSFLEICNTLRKKEADLSGIAGISYRNSGKVFHNEPRALIDDIDNIPFPATHLILYPESFNYKSMGSMIVSRGCPWRCTFCSSRLFWEKKLRMRSPQNIIDEIKVLKRRYNLNYIMFWDDSFSVHKKVITKYCKGLADANLNVRWRTATRADLVDEEILRWMKKAGCVKLEIGVETGSPRMQKIIAKDVNNELVKKAFGLIKANGIATGAFFMAGFPDETDEDMTQTFQLMKELGIEEIAYNIFDPMPGSDALKRCEELGLVAKDADWSNFRFWPDSHFMINMTREDFLVKATEIGKWVYAYNNSFPVKFRKLKALIWFYILNDPGTLVKKAVHYISRRNKVRRLNY